MENMIILTSAAHSTLFEDQLPSGVSGNDLWGFGNGNGIENFIPKVQTGNRIEKAHSQNSWTEREYKNPFPNIGIRNCRPLFLGMPVSGNSCSPLHKRQGLACTTFTLNYGVYLCQYAWLWCFILVLDLMFHKCAFLNSRFNITWCLGCPT